MVSDVFCHVGVIIKVHVVFIGDILRYVFEFNTCFSICFCVSIYWPCIYIWHGRPSSEGVFKTLIKTL